MGPSNQATRSSKTQLKVLFIYLNFFFFFFFSCLFSMVYHSNPQTVHSFDNEHLPTTLTDDIVLGQGAYEWYDYMMD